MKTELDRLKAERLMLLGALSEDETMKAQVTAVHAELMAVVEKSGDAGKVAFTLVAYDLGIAEAQS